MQDLAYLLAILAIVVTAAFMIGRHVFPAKRESKPQPRDIFEIAGRLTEFYNQSSHPADLVEINGDFEFGVRLLCEPDVPLHTLCNYVTGDNAVMSCLAIEALTQRSDGPEALDDVLGCVGTVAPWPQYFALNYLLETVPPDQSIVGLVLTSTAGYLDYRPSRSFLLSFIEKRVQAGETPSFDGVKVDLHPELVAKLREFLSDLGPAVRDPLLESFERAVAQGSDPSVLRSAGRLWDDLDTQSTGPILTHETLEEAVGRLESLLLADRPQSCLVVGERGVGKTSILRRLASRLHGQGWEVFVAGHADLIAGQSLMGEFEQRLKAVVAQLRGDKPVVWVIPNIHELAFSGRHQYSPTSALDMILPMVERGQLKIIGETHPQALERLLQHYPRAVTGLAAMHIESLTAKRTLELAKRWIEFNAAVEDPDFLDQTWDLAQQYLGDRAAPGNLLGLLENTVHMLRAGTDGEKPQLRLDDILATLSGQTGLPIDILDHRRELDLKDLRNFLGRRVVGQQEALESLVERVAMMKAGVTDPTRPIGVFLFAGPTGTGKTEIAKTLAEWLFGDAKRMLRFDMSEFQTPESLDRLIGQPREGTGISLADQIRQQPFSVVLLDEFEKAHPNVWDTFLQVFDDARITDRNGRVADFRHSIVILTSNLGAQIPTGASLGFASVAQGFDAGEVKRAIELAFRREFINRLDRVVIFRPLGRDTMREILQKELVDAFQRKGLKYRNWAVEWDEAAIEFLLEKGFTTDLGARPLKRAVERYLLSPLAITIVQHQAPEGDQFLFVSCRDDALEVTFVDPDAPEPVDKEAAEPAPPAPGAPDGDLTPQFIMMHPRGSAHELIALRGHYQGLAGIVDTDDWRQRQGAAYSAMEQPDFWSSPDRFATLNMAEYLDRIAAGTRRAEKLLNRLDGGAHGARDSAPVNMVKVLAQNLFLLDVACRDVIDDRPHEAFLLVEASPDGTQDRDRVLEFAGRLSAMYEAWGSARRMRFTRLEGPGANAASGYRAIYAVMGFGAHSLLAPENGLHVFEWPADRPNHFERLSVHVRVVPQPDGPPPDGMKALLHQARQQLEQPGDTDHDIVRRYREQPTPLVRDAARGWRSGRLDHVLAGNFDVME